MTIEKKPSGAQARYTWLCVAAAACWGLVANAGEFLTGVKGMDAVQLTSLRLIIAGMIFLAWAHARGEKILEPWRDSHDRVDLIITGFVGFGVCQATYFLAIQASNGGTTCVIQNTAPVMVLAYTLIRGRRAPRAGEVLSVAAVVLGAFVLATDGDPGTLVVSPFALIMGLSSAASCALYNVLPERIIGKYSATTVTGWSLLLGGLLLAPFSNPTRPQGAIDAASIAAFAFLVLVGTMATFGLYMSSIPVIGPVKATVICLLEPVVATLVTVTVFHGSFGLAQLIGIFIILAGVLTLTLSSRGHTSSRGDQA